MTARVLVVSGNPGLGMLLGRSGYDVDDCRPNADWSAAASNADVIVLDLGAVSAAGEAISSLGRDVPPVLLVGQEDEEWNDLARNSGAPLLCLPLTPDDVLSQLHSLLQISVGQAIWEAHEGPPVLPASEPADGLTVAFQSRASTVRPRPFALPVTTPPIRSKRPPRARPPHDARPPAASPSTPTPLGELVVGLLVRIGELTSLTDVASAILADAVERCDAEAGALLIQDGDSWTVQASHALRPLERRLRVAGDSWLIERVIDRGLGLLVEGSDIARQRLAGLPVASWDNLVAAPIGGRLGLILLGAHGRKFSEADLARLVAVDDEAAQLIARAVQVRALARALAAYADDAES